MNALTKAMVFWGVGLLFAFFSLAYFLPSLDVTSFVLNALMLLLLVLSLFIMRYETDHRARNTVLHFSFFFALAIPYHLFNFLDRLFPHSPFAWFYINQYGECVSILLLTFGVTYFVVDILLERSKTAGKYLVSLALVLFFFTYNYYPFFLDSQYAYQTEAVRNFKLLDVAMYDFKGRRHVDSSPSELLKVADNLTYEGVPGRQLSTAQKQALIDHILPYVDDGHYVILVYSPIYTSSIRMLGLCMGLLIIYFASLVVKRSTGRPLTKMVAVVLLLFCIVEVLKRWIFIHSVEWDVVGRYVMAGQYVAAAVLALLAGVLAFHLRQITPGKYDVWPGQLSHA